MELSSFYAHGKLLLTGEYFVLDGAVAAAVPTRQGQHLLVKKTTADEAVLVWQSIDNDGSVWLEATFQLSDFQCISHSNLATAEQLQQILKAVRTENKDFLAVTNGHKISVETRLEFPKKWGLGSSSTLLSMVAQWAKVDAFELLAQTMGGSGYDIACATSKNAILFKKSDNLYEVKNILFEPVFTKNLYFIYLEKKQNSRDGIAQYRKKGKPDSATIQQISDLTYRFIAAQTLSELEQIIAAHEQIISENIALPRAKTLFFADFWGEIKSLGAWGGDFVLATSERSELETKTYFHQKGYNTFFRYDQLV